MQAAGIQIVSTYIFWNHHEEIEGQFDWTGRRDLRHFIQICARHHMYVVLRVGPWAHGEARYGGLPDWVVQKSKAIRTNDSVYLGFVKKFFNQIGMQTQGLLWKDGGPVLGVQLENEYGLKGSGAGVEHISRLKELAIEAGLTVPVYTVTAWPSYRFPPHEMLPMLGGYPDGFWSNLLTNEPRKRCMPSASSAKQVIWGRWERMLRRISQLIRATILLPRRSQVAAWRLRTIGVLLFRHGISLR